MLRNYRDIQDSQASNRTFRYPIRKIHSHLHTTHDYRGYAPSKLGGLGHKRVFCNCVTELFY